MPSPGRAAPPSRPRSAAVRQALQGAALAANRVWPFSRLNRLAYTAALRAFVHLCAAMGEVRSVYLRNGLLRDDWVPGLSDVDLTVVLDGTLSTAEEVAFLSRFWPRVARLQRFLPMLKDVEVLSERDVGRWTMYRMAGYEAEGWRLLWGAPTVRSHYTATPERLAADALNHAATHYFDYFLPRLLMDDYGTAVATAARRRLARKIRRYAALATGAQALEETANCGADGEGACLAAVLASLEQGVRAVRTDVAAGAGDWQPSRPASWSLAAPDLANARGPVEAILEGDRRLAIVVKDGLDGRAAQRCLALARAIWHARGQTPMLLSASLFDYLGRYDALLYAGWATSRSIVFGRDVLADAKPVDPAAVRANVLDQVPDVAAFPYRRALVASRDPSLLAGRLPDLMLERGLFVALCQDSTLSYTSYDALQTESQGRFPDAYRELRDIRASAGGARDAGVNAALFRLFKGIARCGAEADGPNRHGRPGHVVPAQ